MFTGIIEELGRIRHITKDKIEIECSEVLQQTKIGDSIAVNGVCLTVCGLENNIFTADISQETFNVTTFNQLKTGDFVNLERAMSANGRFGGHIVSGHIDATAICKNLIHNGEFYTLTFELPDDCTKYVIKKGSITINGISLTIANVENKTIKIAVIPHTYENTTLKTMKIGDFVNIEVDIMAKYIEKFLSTSDNKSKIDYNFLQKNGYL